jgi:hypothetical protein
MNMSGQLLAGPYMVQEVDYTELGRALEHTFVEEFGPSAVRDVRVVHFNPDIIDATVEVQARQPAMDDMSWPLSEIFRRDGLRVAIRVIQASHTDMATESGRGPSLMLAQDMRSR